MVNMFTPVASGPSGLEESSTGKKPARPKKAKQAAATTRSLEATAHAADQMQRETGEAAGGSLPGFQTSAQPGPEKLMVELHEHAALVEHNRPVEPEVLGMDTREGGGASEQQMEQQHEHRRRQQQEQLSEQQPAQEFRAYETHRHTPTA